MRRGPRGCPAPSCVSGPSTTPSEYAGSGEQSGHEADDAEENGGGAGRIMERSMASLHERTGMGAVVTTWESVLCKARAI